MFEPKSSLDIEKVDSNSSFYNMKALNIMLKMGYKLGSGLGKHEEGCLEPLEATIIPKQTGLGYKIEGIEQYSSEWDFDSEDVKVIEELEWLSNTTCLDTGFNDEKLEDWIVMGPQIINIEKETEFCDPNLLKQILDAKDIFNKLDENELYKARTRANPFETIRSAFFMNRAALKMANIDAATDFMFTEIALEEHHRKHRGPFYFADVCAGPGGFTEYILWRKQWLLKGFGFTLKTENDFNLQKSVCISPLTFNAHYGAKGDGNVYCPENIVHFSKRVLHETHNMGVHFMMSDGGFSVEGNENLQEVLSKQLYVCQCLVALEIVKAHGHFVTKLFDTYTLFSVGLIFLMYQCFEKVSIFKPNTSRPANSERYLICRNLIMNDRTKIIKEHLWKIVNEYWNLKSERSSDDINEIVPLSVIQADKTFLDYIIRANNRLGKKQLLALKKMTAFCLDPTLVEARQEELRKKCLEHWKIPDFQKIMQQIYSLDSLITQARLTQEMLYFTPTKVSYLEDLKYFINSPNDWYYVPLKSNKDNHACTFFAGIDDSKVYKLVGNKWTRVKNLHLIKGTLLYGEMVNETIVKKEEDGSFKDAHRYSLQVIDALRLGDVTLENKNFSERLKIIETYCEAVNHESRNNYVRIRVKKPRELDTLMWDHINYDEENKFYVYDVPVLGLDSVREFYTVNSLLLLKMNENQDFISMYTSASQLLLTNEENGYTILDFKS